MDTIILAGGKGTRLGEIGKETPKSLLKIHSKLIIEYIFENLPDEIDRVILVIGHLGEKIKETLGNEFDGKKIEYVEIEPRGTGYALWQVKNTINGNRFLVLNGDDIYDKNELAEMLTHPRSFGLTLSKPKTNKYLSMRLSDENFITGYGYVNEDEMKNGALIGTGSYVLDKGIFNFKLEHLSSGGEYGLPQTILKNLNNYPIKGVAMKNWIQINFLEDIVKAEEILIKQKSHHNP